MLIWRGFCPPLHMVHSWVYRIMEVDLQWQSNCSTVLNFGAVLSFYPTFWSHQISHFFHYSSFTEHIASLTISACSCFDWCFWVVAPTTSSPGVMLLNFSSGGQLAGKLSWVEKRFQQEKKAWIERENNWVVVYPGRDEKGRPILEL